MIAQQITSLSTELVPRSITSIIDDLRQEVLLSSSVIHRVILSRDNESLLQDMLLFAKCGFVYPMHLHRARTEIFTCLEGTLSIDVVEGNGSETRHTLLPNMTIAIPQMCAHRIVTSGSLCIFREIGNGPFTRHDRILF